MRLSQTLIPLLCALLGLAGGYHIGLRRSEIVVKQGEYSNSSGSTLKESTVQTRSERSKAESADLAPSSSGEEDQKESLARKDSRIKELEQELAAIQGSREVLSSEADLPEFREKLASELLELTQTKKLIENSFTESMKHMFKEQGPELQHMLPQLLQKHYSWDKIEKDFAQIYTEVFTAQELSDMAAYFRSDVGQAMLRKQPDVMEKTLKLIQRINQENFPKLQKEVQSLKPGKKNALTDELNGNAGS